MFAKIGVIYFYVVSPPSKTYSQMLTFKKLFSKADL